MQHHKRDGVAYKAPVPPESCVSLPLRSSKCLSTPSATFCGAKWNQARSSNSQEIKLPPLWIKFDLLIIQTLKGSSRTGNLSNWRRCRNSELSRWTSCLWLVCLSDTFLRAEQRSLTCAASVQKRLLHANWESDKRTVTVAADKVRIKPTQPSEILSQTHTSTAPHIRSIKISEPMFRSFATLRITVLPLKLLWLHLIDGPIVLGW